MSFKLVDGSTKNLFEMVDVRQGMQITGCRLPASTWRVIIFGGLSKRALLGSKVAAYSKPLLPVSCSPLISASRFSSVTMTSENVGLCPKIMLAMAR